jgi:hypothetical protein
METNDWVDQIKAEMRSTPMQALEVAKTAMAVALEILDTELRWLASTRATTFTGLKLKASYASIEGALANSIVEDMLQL